MRDRVARGSLHRLRGILYYFYLPISKVLYLSSQPSTLTDGNRQSISYNCRLPLREGAEASAFEREPRPCATPR